MSVPAWVANNFEKIKRIAARHDMRCPLRVAMITDNAAKECNCNGKLSVYGEPKTTPRERTLGDVKRALGVEGAR